MASPVKANVVRFGVFDFDLPSGELRKDGMRIRLEGQPVAILRMLLDRPGELVTREELQKRLWVADTFVDFEHSLNAAVRRLRAALNDSADQPRYVETLARRGYRFVAPVNGSFAGPSAAIIEPLRKATPIIAPAPAAVHQFRRWLVGVAAVCVVGALAWSVLRLRRGHEAAPPAPVIRSLAVLPLESLSGDSSQEYFADGMTDELITDLAQIGSLRVISRTSVMHYKGMRKPLPEIARELGVDGIVEGTISRSGGRVRITSQLIYAPADQHLWARSYERDLSDALALQSDIAQAIADEVRATIAPDRRTRLATAKAVNLQVYENYLKGQFALENSHSRADIDESIGYFQKAIEQDPTFAHAYVGLGFAYNGRGSVLVGGAPPEAERMRAANAARKALELDPTLADSHVLLGDIQEKEWHWVEAEAEYRRALELNPNNVGAHAGLAIWMLCQGRTDEAVAWSQRGRELDPLSAGPLGWVLFNARRYDEAQQEYRSMLAVRPDYINALWSLGFVYLGNRQPEAAVPVLEKAVLLSNRSSGMIGVLIRAYAQSGRRNDALRLLEELKRRRQKGYVPAAAFVNAYLGLGDNDQAFVWLEQAYKEKSNFLQWLKVHPFFDPLRNDSRFDDLLRRTNLGR